MKIEKFDGAQERAVLTSFMVSTETLARLSPLLRESPFPDKWANVLASLCVKYYDKYKRAPGRDIEGLFIEWSEGREDKDTIELVERLLRVLSDEYERLESEVKPDYAVDMASGYFEREQVKKFLLESQNDAEVGNYHKIGERIKTFSFPEVESDQCVDLFHDMNAIRSACEYSREESIVKYPDGLGTFFGSDLKKQCFIAFEGPDKSGKSFWLLDLAFRAVLQRNRVIYFEAGDLTQDQVVSRFVVRAAQHPIMSPTGDWPCVVEYPREITRVNGKAHVRVEDRRFSDQLDFRKAWKAARALMRDRVKSDESYFKLCCYPNDTLSVDTIEQVIQDQSRRGWVADLCIIDYSDILAPLDKENEVNNINKIWKRLRKVSQSENVLLATATQTNARAYEARIITKKHFSGCKGKLAHVTSMYAINISEEDREHNVCRLNCVERREGANNELRCCYVAQCLALAHPSVCSIF